MNHDLFNAVQNRDGAALATMAGHARNTTENVIDQEAARLVDKLFNQLKLVFPAAGQTALKSDAHETAAKRQWIAAFAEGGIRSLDQLTAGMRQARASTSPFWPSPGLFVSWCKDSSTILGVSIEEAMAEFHRYNRDRGLATSPEKFNWSKPVLYWVVTDARQAMLQRCLSESEVESFITRKLSEWAKKVAAGEQIPDPVQMLESKSRPAAYQPSANDYEYRYMPNAAHMGSVTPAQWLQAEYQRRKELGLTK
ncbi:replication protein P [Pantoea sp. R13S299]|uniref:replication protein P n=1 Tax=Pantoea sp. R13S299 TaxID=3402751 RepID=UPI003AE8A2FB